MSGSFWKSNFIKKNWCDFLGVNKLHFLPGLAVCQLLILL